jgi:hypothetical protein
MSPPGGTRLPRPCRKPPTEATRQHCTLVLPTKRQLTGRSTDRDWPTQWPWPCREVANAVSVGPLYADKRPRAPFATKNLDGCSQLVRDVDPNDVQRTKSLVEVYNHTSSSSDASLLDKSQLGIYDPSCSPEKNDKESSDKIGRVHELATLTRISPRTYAGAWGALAIGHAHCIGQSLTFHCLCRRPQSSHRALFVHVAGRRASSTTAQCSGPSIHGHARRCSRLHAQVSCNVVRVPYAVGDQVANHATGRICTRRGRQTPSR